MAIMKLKTSDPTYNSCAAGKDQRTKLNENGLLLRRIQTRQDRRGREETLSFDIGSNLDKLEGIGKTIK